MLAERLPMGQTCTSQLSSGECSQARRSTGETTGSRINESSQLNKSTCSYHGEKFDAFLSHSGKQKDFVRQLYRDLTNQGVSCFFDQDRESLPVAENFPSRIFEAAETCKVAVLLLSEDFLQTKWPMQELFAFVEARDITVRNPNLKILPLFFGISPDALTNTKENDEKWKQLGISKEKRSKWHGALKAIRPINGLKFSEGGDKVKFRDEIVKEIWHILPTPSPRYHVRGMQGEERMCQEVANLFNKVQPNKKGIRIAGLYDIAGRGKTTLGKAFCNFKLGEFEGKVCHLEFSRGDPTQNIKSALQYLAHRPQSYVQTLTIEDQAKVEFYRRMKGQKILLVLDNITDENIDRVKDYLQADIGENSHILLTARSVDILVNRFDIDKQSCMRVPRLQEEEAIAILFEGAFAGEPTLRAEDRGFALKSAKRCLFKETCCDIVPRPRTFHPLALKAFGGYLKSKYGSDLSKWAAEVDAMVEGAGDGLDDVFVVLGKAFDRMLPKYRTIFMLLTVYMLPNMSPHKVSNWLAIICNEEISFIEKAVEALRKKAFIEEFKPEIRIHDLYIEFAQSKANKMERWLWWRKKDDQCVTRGLIAQDKDGFELAKLEQCIYRRIAPKYLRNLFMLQLVDVQSMSKLDLGTMDSLRNITLHNCTSLAALDGMEKLLDLAWLQIRGVDPMFKLPELSSLEGLQHLEIDIGGNQVVDQLGDLTHCLRLREINVICPSLLNFPRLKGMKHLEKVEFSLCGKVKGPVDCTDCVKLQTIVLNFCSQMVASPLLGGCKKLSKIVLSECDALTACPDVHVPSALKTLDLFLSSKAASAPKNLEFCCELENFQLWNMAELRQLPSFRRLSNLTVLNLGKCGLRQPPDLTGCKRLEEVCFFSLKKLERFPSFSSLRELKKLSLYDCISVQHPPDIEGCHQLQVFHLLYNDNMQGISRMDKCPQLEEIKLSWHCKSEVTYEGIDSDSCQVGDDLESCLDYWKDVILENLDDVYVPVELEEWMKGKSMLAKKYFRGVKLYYSVTAPYYSVTAPNGRSKRYSPSSITLRLVDSKVMAFLTLARANQDRGRLNEVPEGSDGRADIARASQDRDWLDKVREYFDGREDFACASAASVSINIVEAISLPPMQGEARMCQEVADFFNTVHPIGKGIRIAGLYGMPGQGKTTLAKAFCNRNLRNFDGKVCHLEFCGVNTLRCLSQFPIRHLEMHVDDAYYVFNKLGMGKRVLLVVDNITDTNIRKVICNLPALREALGENSWVLLSAPRVDVLLSFIDSRSCMCVPRLDEEEAIAILWEGASGFPAESRDFALKCAKKAAFHPLALKVFGRQLFRKQSKHLSQWAAEIDEFAEGADGGSNDVFVMVDEVFDGIDDICRTIFMLLARHMLPNMSTKEALMWLAKKCNEEILHIEKAIEDLCDSGFIEVIEPEIRIHDLLMEFAQTKGYHCLVSSNIVEAISLPPMQGEARMCQELADLFNTVRPNGKGIRIAGLYGMPGQGKTTLAKAFCYRKLRNFDGRVFHLEFGGGNKLDRQKLALGHLESGTSEDDFKLQVHYFFNRLGKGKRALLVLDNITYESRYKVIGYLSKLGENSWVLLSARRVDVLVKYSKYFNIDSQSCMRVPRLEEEEAIAILWEKKPSGASGFPAESRDFALKCAKKCSFKDEGGFAAFHPLALKTFGRHLFRKQSKHLSQWAAEIDEFAEGAGGGSNDVFVMLDEAFDGIDDICRTIFMLLARHMPPNMSTKEAFMWLAEKCNEQLPHIEKAVADLCESAFIEETEPEIRIHEVLKEFAQMDNKNMYDRLGSF